MPASHHFDVGTFKLPAENSGLKQRRIRAGVQQLAAQGDSFAVIAAYFNRQVAIISPGFNHGFSQARATAEAAGYP